MAKLQDLQKYLDYEFSTGCYTGDDYKTFERKYINCSTYYKNSEMTEKWCLHPLPIMTCIGNGLGGGDYSSPTDDSTEEYVGYWAWDEISIEDQPPANYTEIEPVFKEKGWD